MWIYRRRLSKLSQYLCVPKSRCQTGIRWFVRLFISAVLTSAAASQTSPRGSSPVLTNVAQIRELTLDEARRKHPIRLDGVIPYRAPAYMVTFFQDTTAGIFVFIPSSDPQVKTGSRVEVEGNTTPGHFAPSIEHARIRVLGNAALPSPALKTLEDLLSGREDSQWIETRGIVHSVAIEDQLPPDMRRGPPQLV